MTNPNTVVVPVERMAELIRQHALCKSSHRPTHRESVTAAQAIADEIAAAPKAHEAEGEAWRAIETAPLDTVILAAEHVIGDKWSVWMVRVLPEGVVDAWTMQPMSFRESPPQPFKPTLWMPVPAVRPALAQEIRRVDGDNRLGAGALAEALMPFLALTPAGVEKP